MNRRAFLSPAAAEAAPAVEPEQVLLRFSRRAMATQFEIALPLGTSNAHAAAAAALDLIDALESQLSAYREDSELRRLNAAAFAGPVAVEPRFFELLVRLKEWNAASGGAFDPAAGALIEAWGFFQGPPRVPTFAERQEALRRSGLRFVELDEARQTVRFHREGLKLNLGAVGKGYALDRAAELLRAEFGVGSALLIGGRSSILALGAPPGGAGWSVNLSHPTEPDQTLGVLRLGDQALGTSAGTYRGLEHQGRRLSHLLDPRTGWPGERWLGASCVAPTAAAADAWATAFYLMTENEIARFVAERPGVGAVVVPAAGAVVRFGAECS